MPAPTFDTTTPAIRHDSASRSYKTRRFRVTLISDADTFSTGIKGIYEVYWQPDLSTDTVSVTADSATGIVTFSMSAGSNKAGTILVRSRG